MAHHQPFQITGFHSCDRKVGLDIINGRARLNPSINPWDWLGTGAYFWEQNPKRALDYAIDCANGTQKFSGSIKTPFVIGATIELGHCLNLIEPDSLEIVRDAYQGLIKTLTEAQLPIPKNNGANRKLDCMVIQYVHESIKLKERRTYDTVRSAFREGLEVYPGANFTDGSHIEVSVINVDMIKGYFLPLPLEEFNPYLNKEFVKDDKQKANEK